MKKNVVAGNSAEFSLVDESFLKNKVYTIRGVKVMLDADLAEIYGYETKRFKLGWCSRKTGFTHKLYCSFGQ